MAAPTSNAKRLFKLANGEPSTQGRLPSGYSPRPVGADRLLGRSTARAPPEQHGKVENGLSIRHIPAMTAASGGKPVFRIAIGRRVHISGWPAVLLAPLAIPVILLIKLAQHTCSLKTSADLTARDVENYLRDFLHETGGAWDWDDFISVAITDPSLEGIRREAAFVPLPLDAEGEAILQRLLEKVRAM